MKRIILIGIVIIIVCLTGNFIIAQKVTKQRISKESDTKNDIKREVKRTGVISTKEIKGEGGSRTIEQGSSNQIFERIIKNSEPIIEQTGKGLINWTEQYIEATGQSVIDTVRFRNYAQARAMAMRGAIVDAQRNLLEIINGVRVVGETTVENMIATNDYIYSRVDGIIRGAQLIGDPKEKYGMIEIKMRVPLYASNGLAATVITPTKTQEHKTKGSSVAKPDIQSIEQKFEAQSLAFNLNGKEFDPALFPLVVDKDGNVLLDFTEIYDPEKGKFPKILKSSRELFEAAGLDKAIEIIDIIDAKDGKLIVDTKFKKKFNWGKISDTISKIGKFLLMLI